MTKKEFFLNASIALAKEFVRVGLIGNSNEFDKNLVSEKAAASAAALMDAVEAYWMETLENESSPFDTDAEETPVDDGGGEDTTDTTDTTETDGEGGEGSEGSGSGEG